MAREKNEDVLWTPAFVVLIATMFFAAFMSIGLNAGIALHFDMLGHPSTTTGMLLAIFTASSTVIRVLSGDWTDRYSHKKLLIAGSALMLVGCALPLASESMPVMVAARIFQGMGMSLQSTVTAVLTALAVSPNRLSEAQGYRGLGTALATAIGPSVAVWAVTSFGGFGMFAIYSVIMLAGLLMVTFFKFEDHSGDHADGEDIQEEEAPAAPQSDIAEALASNSVFHRYFELSAFPAALTEMTRRLIDGITSSFAVIYGLSLGFENASIFFITSSAGIIVCRLFLSKWMNTAKSLTAILVIALSAIIGFGAIALFPNFWVYCLAGFCLGISDGFGAPFFMSLSIKSTVKERWGVASANFYLAGDVGMALGGFIGGVFIDLLGIWVLPWFVIAAALAMFAVSRITHLK